MSAAPVWGDTVDIVAKKHGVKFDCRVFQRLGCYQMNMETFWVLFVCFLSPLRASIVLALKEFSLHETPECLRAFVNVIRVSINILGSRKI